MTPQELEAARIDGRLAVLPGHIRPGGTIYFWDSIDCQDEACMDAVTPACPSNHGMRGESVARCQLCHPVLRKVDVWSVYALFGSVTDPLWVINETYTFSDDRLSSCVFDEREAAEAHRPRTLLRQ